ncbi:hypothetical protein [Nocardia abscessus]|uniref:hypothetical protein n=1 Tax=Nocardia abscessus TaxID=120957 RepID=UPI003CC7ED13
MPKLWNDTITAHRQVMRDALLDTTAGLVAENGLASVTITQIVEQPRPGGRRRWRAGSGRCGHARPAKRSAMVDRCGP